MRINRPAYIAHTPRWPQNAPNTPLPTAVAAAAAATYEPRTASWASVRALRSATTDRERERTHISRPVFYRVSVCVRVRVCVLAYLCISTSCRVYRLPVCGTYASNSLAYPHACCSGYNADLSRAEPERERQLEFYCRRRRRRSLFCSLWNRILCRNRHSLPTCIRRLAKCRATLSWWLCK